MSVCVCFRSYNDNTPGGSTQQLQQQQLQQQLQLQQQQSGLYNAHSPLHTFPRSFLVDDEAANLLRTCRLCCGLVVDNQSCLWIGLTQGLGWVGLVVGR